jgi:hypothetical protein
MEEEMTEQVAVSGGWTKGPWAIEDPFDFEFTIVESGKSTDEWRFIASIPIPDEDDDEELRPRFTNAEAQANAHLIAALKDFRAFTERPEIKVLLDDLSKQPPRPPSGTAVLLIDDIDRLMDAGEKSTEISTPPSSARARARDPHPRCGDPFCPVCYPRD